jgi:hypothetical protein
VAIAKLRARQPEKPDSLEVTHEPCLLQLFLNWIRPQPQGLRAFFCADGCAAALNGTLALQHEKWGPSLSAELARRLLLFPGQRNDMHEIAGIPVPHTDSRKIVPAGYAPAA